jgi:hypothetical protein
MMENSRETVNSKDTLLIDITTLSFVLRLLM